MRTWLFRVLENDDDGDPLDWGAVDAVDFETAQQLVAARWAEIIGDYAVDVGFYEVTAKDGIYASEPRVTVTIGASA